MDPTLKLCLVAKMYYVDHMKQSEIADRLNCSVMLVSRWLKRAQDEGIVTIRVKAPSHINWEMSAQLKRKFPQMREIFAVDVLGDGSDRERVGVAAAELAAHMLKKDSILGVSWGRTILEFARHIQGSLPDMRVLQMSGGFLSPDQEEMTPASIVRKVSDRLGCKALFLNAPLVVASREVRDSLQQDETLRYISQMAANMDISLYGLSRLDTASTMSMVGAISREDIAELHAAGAVGDIMGYFINARGDVIHWSKGDCYTGVPLETAASARHAICVATGVEKAQVLLLTIRKQYCNTLVVGSDLANSLLQA